MSHMIIAATDTKCRCFGLYLFQKTNKIYKAFTPKALTTEA